MSATQARDLEGKMGTQSALPIHPRPIGRNVTGKCGVGEETRSGKMGDVGSSLEKGICAVICEDYVMRPVTVDVDPQ